MEPSSPTMTETRTPRHRATADDARSEESNTKSADGLSSETGKQCLASNSRTKEPTKATNRPPPMQTGPRPDLSKLFLNVPSVPFLYLLHFDVPRHHARHYLGSSDQLESRLAAHATGRGARLTRALWEEGEQWTLAAIFALLPHRTSGRDTERMSKKRHNAKAYCPLCTRNHRSPTGTVQFPIQPISSLDYQ